MAEEDRIDPWSSAKISDYDRLIRQFGIQEFDPEGLPRPTKLFRRNVVFGHRGFDYVKDAVDNDRSFAILSGLMPSGNMHLGNKMVLDQVLYFQSLGADVFLLVADIESYATRDISFEKAREIAIETYILNYIALGLDSKGCQIYFQSKRSAVKDLAYISGKKTNWSTMRSIYGFGDQTNMSHVFSPLVQVGDILHVQLEEYGGPRPVLVPVGVDQDPHMRLTRDIASSLRYFNVTRAKDGRMGVFVKVDEEVDVLLEDAKEELTGLGFEDLEIIPKYKALYLNDATEDDIIDIDRRLSMIEQRRRAYGFLPPASTYHRFMSGLTGGKMSSSVPQSSIFLNDAPEEAVKKISTAVTGGGQTLEEHKKHGGDPDRCSIFELFLFHLLDDDRTLEQIYRDCREGKQTCGMCKKLAKDLIREFFEDLAEKREAARDRLDDYLRED